MRGEETVDEMDEMKQDDVRAKRMGRRPAIYSQIDGMGLETGGIFAGLYSFLFGYLSSPVDSSFFLFFFFLFLLIYSL